MTSLDQKRLEFSKEDSTKKLDEVGHGGHQRMCQFGNFRWPVSGQVSWAFPPLSQPKSRHEQTNTHCAGVGGSTGPGTGSWGSGEPCTAGLCSLTCSETDTEEDSSLPLSHTCPTHTHNAISAISSTGLHKALSIIKRGRIL